MITINAGLSIGKRKSKDYKWKNVQRVKVDCEWPDTDAVRKRLGELYPGWFIDGYALIDDEPENREILYHDGQPCKHPGCFNHITHRCEGCGRIESKGTILKPLLEITDKNGR